MPAVLPVVTIGAALVYAGLVLNANLRKYALDVLYLYHPALAVVGLLLAVIGIQTAQKPHTQPSKHKSSITVHGYWQSAASMAFAGAGYIIYANKENNKRPHLVSWHGKVGAVVTLTWLSVTMVGALLWYAPKLVAPNGGASLKQLYRVHGYFGYFAFVAMLGAHGLALAGGYQGYAVQSQIWYGLCASLAVVGLLTVLGIKRGKPSSKSS